jgi:hypothetical protein
MATGSLRGSRSSIAASKRLVTGVSLPPSGVMSALACSASSDDEATASRIA